VSLTASVGHAPDDGFARSKECATCDGSGKIKGNTTKCPDCGGSGTMGVEPVAFTATEVDTDTSEIEVREPELPAQEPPAPAPAPEPASSDPLHIPDAPTTTIEERLAAIESAISPVLELQRDEILSRHPAPPEPSPLEQYLQARGQ
jgi:hypothetical protein